MKLRLVRLLLVTAGTAGAQLYVVSTVAGGAPPPTPLVARRASLQSTSAVATDAAGHVYFASSNCIFQIDPSDTLTRIAGTSRAGYSGDGGPAIAAQLNNPTAVAPDAAGNLYIADFGNGRIRKITASGSISTVASQLPVPHASGFQHPLALALDNAGNVYFSDPTAAIVEKLSLDGKVTLVAGTGYRDYSADGGAAVNASLGEPYGLAFDAAGNLYIVDSGYGRIRKVAQDGTISSFGVTDYYDPNRIALVGGTGMTIDRAGNFYIANQSSSRIIQITPDGKFDVAAGTGVAGFSGDSGPATSAELNQPTGVALDAKGNLYIADASNYRIRQVSPDLTVSTLAGDGNFNYSGDGGAASAARLGHPQGLTVDSNGNLYVADAVNHRVRKLSVNGPIATIAGSTVAGFAGDNGSAASALLDQPSALALDVAGNLLIADQGSGRIRKIATLTGSITTAVGGGVFACQGACSPNGLGDGGLATNAELLAPEGIAADSSGNLYIADTKDNALRTVSADALINTIVYGGMLGFDGLSKPNQVAVDRAGNLFIAEDGPILKLTPGGVISSTKANAHAGTPLAIDASGNLLFVGPCAGQISRLSAEGIPTVIAGQCDTGYSGDGGPALGALFNNPQGLTVDGAGNIYVADTGNGVIRLLRPTSYSALIGAVVNAASEIAGPVSPGEIVILYGAGLGPAQLTQAQAQNGIVGTQLGGTVVTFNGMAAPLLYSYATQVAAIVPYGVTGSTVQASVSYLGQTSPAFSVPGAASAPGLFTLDQSNAGPAAAVNADGQINSPGHPVALGGYISLYATGEGQTEAAGADGKIATAPLPHPVLPVSVTIGGQPANVTYYGAAPGQVAGLMQVNVQIPDGVAPGGYVPVFLKIGDTSSQLGVTLSVAVSAQRSGSFR